jgi:hypothetical protein
MIFSAKYCNPECLGATEIVYYEQEVKYSRHKSPDPTINMTTTVCDWLCDAVIRSFSNDFTLAL